LAWWPSYQQIKRTALTGLYDTFEDFVAAYIAVYAVQARTTIGTCSALIPLYAE
tara:strand:+ start:294 stop:455 length:162 start_codon:yes stop_codon:yes gene_type:complete